MANNILMKVNFNSAAVKIGSPTQLPTISVEFLHEINSYKVTINPNLVNQDYLHAIIKINNEEYSIENLTGSTEVIVNASGETEQTFELTGYYRISYYNQDIGRIYSVLKRYMICAETTICSETAIIADLPTNGG